MKMSAVRLQDPELFHSEWGLVSLYSDHSFRK